MAKLNIILVLFPLFIALLPSAYSKPEVTKIRFFVQDTFTGRNQSVFPVAQSDITSNSHTMFGQVAIIDDPLTVEPSPDSEILGRAQGIIAFADLNQQALHVSVTFVFTSGEYNGSTLTMVGRNEVAQETRRIPIVGGTGAFDLAQGIVTTTSYSSDSATNADATFEYNIVVAQYCQEINMYA